MTEFVDNNAISPSIEQSAFFLNKSFHSHMSFDSNSTEYEIIRARIEMIISVDQADISKSQSHNKETD